MWLDGKVSPRFRAVAPAVCFFPVAVAFWVLGGLGGATVIFPAVVSRPYWETVGVAGASLIVGAVIAYFIAPRLDLGQLMDRWDLDALGWYRVLRTLLIVGGASVVVRSALLGIPVLSGSNEARFSVVVGSPLLNLLPFGVLTLQAACFVALASWIVDHPRIRSLRMPALIVSIVLLSAWGGRRFMVLLPMIGLMFVLKGRVGGRAVVALLSASGAFIAMGIRRGVAVGDTQYFLYQRASWDLYGTVLVDYPWLAQVYIPLRGAAEVTGKLAALTSQQPIPSLPLPTLVGSDWVPFFVRGGELGEYAVTRYLLGGDIAALGPTAVPFIAALRWDGGLPLVSVGCLALGFLLHSLFLAMLARANVLSVFLYGFGLSMAVVGLYGGSITSIYTVWQLVVVFLAVAYYGGRRRRMRRVLPAWLRPGGH